MLYDNNLLQEKPYSLWWTGYSVVVDHYVIHHKLRDRAKICVISLILWGAYHLVCHYLVCNIYTLRVFRLDMKHRSQKNLYYHLGLTNKNRDSARATHINIEELEKSGFEIIHDSVTRGFDRDKRKS